MGYPKDILETRSIVKPGEYAVIPPTGLVNNVIPGIEGCRISIVASPKYGASFVQETSAVGTKNIRALRAMKKITVYPYSDCAG